MSGAGVSFGYKSDQANKEKQNPAKRQYLLEEINPKH